MLEKSNTCNCKCKVPKSDNTYMCELNVFTVQFLVS